MWISLHFKPVEIVMLRLASCEQGSWIVKQSVGKTACLIGEALEITYHTGKNYIEVLPYKTILATCSFRFDRLLKSNSILWWLIISLPSICLQTAGRGHWLIICCKGCSKPCAWIPQQTCDWACFPYPGISINAWISCIYLCEMTLANSETDICRVSTLYCHLGKVTVGNELY